MAWHGHETTLLEIGSDRDLYSIAFCGPKGQTLKGTFGGGPCENCEFTGVKVGIPGTKTVDVAQEWVDRNETAYDYYSSAGWH